MRKYCLLIGDGLTKDFVAHSKMNINTSKPFHKFFRDDISYDTFIHNISDTYEELRQLSIDINDDFDAIKMFLQKYQDTEEYIKKESDLRRFLTLAYTEFQLLINPEDISGWRWYKWLNENSKGLSFAITFNYDLLLENTLDKLGISYYRTGAQEPIGKVPILKPHGSIDLDIQNSHNNPISPFREYIEAAMRWGIVTFANQVNGVVQTIPPRQWRYPRLQADVIPPSQENYHSHLKWIRSGFNLFEKATKYKYDIDDLIIIGHSYRPEDQEEVNFFIERLRKRTTVTVVNPNPSPELRDKIKDKSLKYNLITDFETMPW